MFKGKLIKRNIMLNSFFAILIFLYSSVIQPIIFIILKPLFCIFNIKLNWNLNAYITIYHLLGIRNIVKKREKIIDSGFIIPNHRCFFDFVFDPFITNSAVLGRREAFWACSFSYILGLFDNRMISFSRGDTSRHEVFKKILYNRKVSSFKRTLFYAEGTRCKYKSLSSLSDIKQKLKLGLLKCIYELKTEPIQLCISSNKEEVFNEKNLSMKYNIKVNTCFSKKIHPKDFDSFEGFVNKICDEWFECWKITHL